jgi:hypothetical protein
MSWLHEFLEREGEQEATADDLAACEADIAGLCRQMHEQTHVDRAQNVRMDVLEAEVAEMRLYLATVIRLLMAKGQVTREDFARLVAVIDASDGAVDGQFDGDIARRQTWTGEPPKKP